MSRPDPALWARVERLLDDLLELEPAERARALERLAVEQPELRGPLEALMRADSSDPGVLEAGVGPLAAGLLEAGPGDPPEESEFPQVERYRIVRFLGRGGMGTVWLAERTDGHFGRAVALKVLKRGLDSDEIRRRFLLEREILARLEHPGIARLLDGGVVQDGRPYFAMEFIEGRPLTSHADALRLDLRQRLRLFEDVCEAVSHAQHQLIVHRDLKPSNILVTAEGQVKLLDFGIAKLLAESDLGSESPGLTRAGQVLLTPEYAAPEQLRGEPVTMATDVFALGVILYELLSGRHPFPRGSSFARLAGHASEPEPLAAPAARSRSRAAAESASTTAEAIASARGTLPGPLRRLLRGDLSIIVDKALRPEPGARYASAATLLEDLRRFRTGRPLHARPATLGYRARKYVRRHRVAVGAATAAFLALGIGLVGTIWQARAARRQAVRATAVTEFLSGLFEGSDPDAGVGSDPTARDLLARGAARIDSDLGGQPELQAELFRLIGRLYDKLGDYDSALPLLGRALEIRERLFPPGHPLRRESLLDLGSAHLQAMHLEVADSLLHLAVPHFSSPTARDSSWSTLLNNLAVLENRLGHEAEAESLYREALRVDRSIHGDEHVEVATDLSNLTSLLTSSGKLEEAESTGREALAMRRRLHPAGHTSIPYALHNLAFVIRKEGRIAEADSIYRECIERRRRVYPAGHPALAQTLRERASIRSQQGDYATADTLLREAAAMCARFLGEEHPDYALTLNELALVSFRRRDLAGAATGFARAAELLERSLPAGHPTLMTVQGNLAGTLERAGRTAEARAAKAKLERMRAAAAQAE